MHTYDENTNNCKDKKRISSQNKWLILFSIIVPGGICIAFGFFNIWNLKHMGEINLCGENFIVGDLLSSGIAIVAIAVSVWIGLNIYNYVSGNERERELDDRLRKSKELECRRDLDLKKSLFQNELFKTVAKYPISELFYVKVDEERMLPEKEKEMDDLIRFEKKYANCCEYYESNRYERCIRLCHELLEDFKKICVIEGKNERARKLINIYKLIREGDIYFYLNASRKRASTKEKFNTSQMLNKSVGNYIKVADILRNGEEMSVIGENVNIYNAYIYNTIGYSYYLANGQKSSPEAKEYMAKAVEENSGNGRYLRNYALCFDSEKDYEGAIEKYKEAIILDNDDYKAYNNVAACTLKEIEAKLKITPDDMENQLLFEFEWDENESENIKSQLNDAESHIDLGLQISATFKDLHMNYGKVYYLRYMISGKNWENRDKGLGEKSIDILKKCEIMSGNQGGYLYVLRNVYEAMKKIKDAKEVNEKIKTTKAEKRDELYKEYLKKEVAKNAK